MKKIKKMPIKVGDNVTIISGFYKNQSGDVIMVNNKSGKITIKGINIKTKHIKPTPQNEIGEIRQIESPIHHSNVKLNL